MLNCLRLSPLLIIHVMSTAVPGDIQGRKPHTGVCSKLLQPDLISCGEHQQHQRTQIIGLLEAFPGEVESPHCQCPIPKCFPFRLCLDVGYRACNVDGRVKIIELEGEVEFVVWISSNLEGKLLQIFMTSNSVSLFNTP